MIIPEVNITVNKSTIPENISTMMKLKFYIGVVLPTLSLLLCTTYPSTDALGSCSNLVTCSNLEEALWCNMSVSCLPKGRLMKGFSSIPFYSFFSNMLSHFLSLVCSSILHPNFLCLEHFTSVG